MRVLQLIQSLARGGAERVVLELAAALDAGGHVSLVALLVDAHEHPEPAFRAVETRILVPRDAFRWPRYVPGAADRLREVVGAWKPDVLLVHTPNAAAVAAWAAPPVPGIYVVHWRWDAEPLTAPRRFRRRVLARWAFARLGRRAVVVAPHLVADSARHFACAPDRIRCVPNGVDLARFPFAVRTPSGTPVIGAVGSLTAVKRPDLLIRAFGAFREIFPRARLRLAGDGPLRPALEALCASLRLEGAVEFMGLRTDVPEILAGCHLLWHAGASEGFGLAVAEAMSAGVPVVAADAPALRELVRDGETGLTAPFEDPEVPARAAAALLRDPVRYGRMARAARAEAEARLGVDRMVAGYLAAATAAAAGRW